MSELSCDTPFIGQIETHDLVRNLQHLAQSGLSVLSLKKEVEEGYSTVNRRICEPAEWLTATVGVTVAQP